MQTRTRLFGNGVNAALCGVLTLAFGMARGTEPRPNFLIIVADDMGFSDVGAFGGEIQTPHIDSLAKGGLRLTGFHTAPSCAPTRSMLLTGADNHEVGMGAQTPTAALRQLGYEGELNEKAATVAELLEDSGYFTAMTGKWHMAESEERSPLARGFKRSFVLQQGGGNHFGRDQDGEPFLTLNTPSTYRQDGKLTRFPVGSYSTDLFTDHMLAYLKEARAVRQPFFAYLAYTAPHWPLQVPDDMLAKYRGRYDDGPEALRAQRLSRMQTLGLIRSDIRPHEMLDIKPWASLMTEERTIEARAMEIYAAMVDRMDQNIGRVIADLKANGEYENTYIIFMSDNGAEGLVSPPRMPPTPHDRKAEQQPDNTLGNMGRSSSYVLYGPGWAQAGTAPSRLFKGRTTEGGIHTPAIVAGPRVQAGRISDATTHVSDIMPTVLELAGVKHPAEYRGRPILPLRGKSWAGLLAGTTDTVRSPTDLMAWELSFNRALLQGDWKAVYLARGAGVDRTRSVEAPHWELFNMQDDPGETTDLAAREPEKLAELVGAWNDYAKEVGVIVNPPAAATQ